MGVESCTSAMKGVYEAKYKPERNVDLNQPLDSFAFWGVPLPAAETLG